jgi:hypothetical protein
LNHGLVVSVCEAEKMKTKAANLFERRNARKTRKHFDANFKNCGEYQRADAGQVIPCFRERRRVENVPCEVASHFRMGISG